MVTDIRVYSRLQMECMKNFLANPETSEMQIPFVDKKWYFISIYGRSTEFINEEVKQIFKQAGMVDSLSLTFWDITDDPEFLATLSPDYILFSTHQAKQVVDFFKRIKEDNGSDNAFLICHCDAGISRSGAVGVFACEFFGLEFYDFFLNNRHVDPNPMVLRMLREEAGLGGKAAFLTAEEIEERNL